jgi:hypothetical protein
LGSSHHAPLPKPSRVAPVPPVRIEARGIVAKKRIAAGKPSAVWATLRPMDTPPRRTERELLSASGAMRTVNRYLARQRQREELRRERDTLVLAIARDIGERALAERMEVQQETVGKLLGDAGNRLNVGLSPTEPMITARRLSRDRHRWAEIDTYYEALGSGAWFALRRGTR